MSDNIKIIGRELVKSYLLDAPLQPGVYQMMDHEKKIIYIGKAKSLKKRLANYTQTELTTRILRMVSQVCHIELIVTRSEAIALLLEAQLIKKFQPKFNILLKDDKSFPYIKLRLDHDFPQVIKYRGKNLLDGKFFGPFASSYIVDATIEEIHKVFKLRNCSDNYFATRKRPCLQYEIKRCYAPCVGKINKDDYNELVKETDKFLSGKNIELQELLIRKMEELSLDMRFEEAAQVRDKIKAVNYIQSKTNITNTQNISDADVIAIAKEQDKYCVQVFLYRASKSYGGKAYFPTHTENASASEVLESFLGQFYQTRMPPKDILLNQELADPILLIQALFELHNIKVSINVPQKGEKTQLIELAYENAKIALEKHLKNSIKNHLILQSLQNLLNLPAIPARIEVYDNSHIMGSFAVGAMIVAGSDGFEKNEYRIFNIEVRKTNCNEDLGTINGDDYEMLRIVLRRRFTKLKKSLEKTPDLIIIDGGRGHMSVVKNIMEEFNINIPFICMSKGKDRNAGREQFHSLFKETFTLDRYDPIMKYLQILRDEAHNYGIKRHRDRRSNAITISSLDNIPNIGKVRKRILLNYFGDFKSISNASVDDLIKAPGINRSIAQTIYDSLHS